MNVLAVIPARGGSIGIPKKNLRLLAGKPLVAHTILHALKARHVNRVVVSTDDEEIVTVSRQYGAEVVSRPPELSGDKASSESALLHVLDVLEETEGYCPDILVFLQCTSPLTVPEDIDGIIGALVDEGADSALAVTPFHHFLWQWDSNGHAVGINHDTSVRLRRQERAPEYLETGAVYAMRTAGFRKAGHRFFGKTTKYVMPRERSLEIDDPVDLYLADLIMRARQEDSSGGELPYGLAPPTGTCTGD